MKNKIKEFSNQSKKSLGKLSIKNIKTSFETIHFKQGSYRSGLSIMVIAIFIIVNMIANQLPASLQSIDLSEERILEVSGTSTEFLLNLEDDIELIVVAETNSTDPLISSFLEKYANTSDALSISWVDPVLHPSVLTEYEVSEDTIVVLNHTTEETTSVSFSEILYSDYDSSYNAVQTFDGDGQLTSAINRLTDSTETTIYTTTGHGEISLPSSLTTSFSRVNYSTEELNTLMEAEMPTDADLIMIYGPTSDFSDEELTILENYIASGGNVLVNLSAEFPDLSNLSAFFESYGLQETEGYIADTERSYQGQPYYLFPNLSLSGDYATEITNETVLILNTKGFSEVEPLIDNVTLTTLMQTSENAYDVTEEDQNQGTYILGAVATQTVNSSEEDAADESEDSDGTEETEQDGEAEETEGKLTVVSSTNMLDSSITDSIPSLENVTLFTNMVSANFDQSNTITIEAKSLSSNQNTVVNPGRYSILFIFVIPIVILVIGFVVWLRRRKA